MVNTIIEYHYQMCIRDRYVAGYVVKTSAFVKNEEGRYEAVVTGASAHAWAEAYAVSYTHLMIQNLILKRLRLL